MSIKKTAYYAFYNQKHDPKWILNLDDHGEFNHLMALIGGV